MRTQLDPETSLANRGGVLPRSAQQTAVEQVRRRSSRSDSSSSVFSLGWFLRLRWCACGLQLVLLGLAVYKFQFDLSIVPILLAIAVIPVSDLIFRLYCHLRSPTRSLIAVLLALDTLVLTVILYYSGGPVNPFSIMYLVHVVLAIILLGERWAWVTVGLSSLCFYFLFQHHQSISRWHASSTSLSQVETPSALTMNSGHVGEDHSEDHHGHQSSAPSQHTAESGHDHLSLHLEGMLYSYILVAVVVAYFLSRIISELTLKDTQLRALLLRQERLASLTAVTANTAHKLGTPLATLVLTSHELENFAKNVQQLEPQQLIADLELLKSESLRCKRIIDEMSRHADEFFGTNCRTQTLGELAAELRAQYPELKVNLESTISELEVPGQAVLIALTALLDNAYEANQRVGEKKLVTFNATVSGEDVVLSVRDQGPGIPKDIQAQFGEPFIATNREGEGMGLGVYLSLLVAEQLGGNLQFIRQASGGTEAQLCFPSAICQAVSSVSRVYA